MPVTLAVPDAVPVKLTGVAQVAVPAIALAPKVQVPEVGVTGPVAAKLTVPVGVVGLVEVSVTFALHVEAWLITIGLEQATLVVVA